jgi:tRNA/rRNA methyltransferase
MLEHPRSALAWLVSDASEPDTAALIFGPEDRGLNNDELSQAQRFIYIPSNPAYPSLNLAQAVGICCYELHEWMANLGLQHQGADLLTQSGLALPEQPSGYFPRSAPLDQLEGFYQQLEQVLLTVGYLYPHTADSRMKKFRRLFGRAMPSSEEVAMLRGILSQVEWAVEHAKKP